MAFVLFQTHIRHLLRKLAYGLACNQYIIFILYCNLIFLNNFQILLSQLHRLSKKSKEWADLFLFYTQFSGLCNGYICFKTITPFRKIWWIYLNVLSLSEHIICNEHQHITYCISSVSARFINVQNTRPANKFRSKSIRKYRLFSKSILVVSLQLSLFSKHGRHVCFLNKLNKNANCLSVCLFKYQFHCVTYKLLMEKMQILETCNHNKNLIIKNILHDKNNYVENSIF